ncbi:RNA-binding protein 4B isoform X2 [Arvicanthis niloticus]|uniref:RNA-binding protein 4B isoform X2 n=1 Tax=Arvicanthis niloticus TaxID=61156 RepID=UPI00402B15B1
MVKLFIGNLPREATEQEIRSLFEQYGKVLECDIIKNYGFVHIEDKTAAEDAIRNLHHYKLHGVNINVEASKNKSKASTKLHVGNISPTCTNQELRAKFEEYGPVIECDIVKDYAFVHMERAEDAVEAIRGLDNTEFQEVTHWNHTNSTSQIKLWPKLQKIPKTYSFCFLVWSCLLIWLLSEAKVSCRELSANFYHIHPTLTSSF